MLNRILPVGTRSALWGVHCFAWHWFPVVLAWRLLYGSWPRWHEAVAIFFHDFPGYWGKPDMDGPSGETHPEAGARVAAYVVSCFRPDLASATYNLSLYHSRYYAARNGAEPSRLCYADKLSVWFDPVWFYLLRATLSGEIWEYMGNAPVAVQHSPRAWIAWYRSRVIDVVRNRERAVSRYV